MGNNSSAVSEPASADTAKTPDASGSPKLNGSSVFRSSSPAEAEELCRALQDRGLCISGSDMETVLAKESNVVNALAFAMTSGMTRKLAKTQRGQVPRASSGSGKKRPKEYMRPPLAPSLSATSPKVNQKRSRPGEQEQEQAPTKMAGSRGERPSKRPAIMRGPSFLLNSAGGGVRMEEDTGGVLTVLQQGSPPRQRLARSRDALALKRHGKSSPTAVATNGLLGFVQMPEKLNIGMLDADMIKATDRWAERAPDQKEIVVRNMIKGLCLDGLGVERKERLDDELALLVHAAMEDLAKSTNIQNGALAIGSRVRAARMIGHEYALRVSGQYLALYGDDDDSTSADSAKGGGGGGGGGSARSRSSSMSSDARMTDGPKETANANNTNHFGGSLSPIGSRLNGPFPPYSPTAPAYSPTSPAYACTPPSPSGSAASSGSARAGGRSSQRPRQQQPSRHFASRSPSNDSRGARPRLAAGHLFNSVLSRKASPPRRSPPPQQQQQGRTEAGAPTRRGWRQPRSEDKPLIGAQDICKAALRKATRSRKEEEWLERQLEAAAKKAADLQRINDDVLKEQQERVNSTMEELELAKKSIEEATSNAVVPHVESSATMEDALRSFISSLPQQSHSPADGLDPLEPRRQAVSVKKEAEAKLESLRVRLMLARHGTNISKVLFHEMFGDLIDRISTVQMQAHERRVARQRSLMSTTKEVLDKYQETTDFYINRKLFSEKRMKKMNGRMDSEAKFFGTDSTEYLATRNRFHDVVEYARDSVETMDIMDDALQQLCSQLELELPEEDMHSLMEDTKRFLAARGRSLVTGRPAEEIPMA